MTEHPYRPLHVAALLPTSSPKPINRQVEEMLDHAASHKVSINYVQLNYRDYWEYARFLGVKFSNDCNLFYLMTPIGRITVQTGSFTSIWYN